MSWKPGASQHLSKVDFAIKYPVEQNVTGTGGVFRQYLVEKKATTFQKYKELAMNADNQPPPGDETMLAKRFWASMGTQSCHPPIYAADVAGASFFEDCAGPWNLGSLSGMLRSKVRPDIEGVTTATVFAGMWRTCFAWHTEDYDLFAINFHHYGSPKHWWAIPPHASERFFRFCETLFPDQRSKCNAFMRHKSFLVSPHKIRDAGIPLVKCIQHEGEFVITLPSSYHSGFNHGFNVAEACNFALPSWVPYGLKAKRCLCREGTVEIDMRLFTLNPNSPASKAVSKQLEIGDVVWASVPGHPQWPARLCWPATNVQRRELEAKRGWYLVLFLGPQRHWAVVPPKDVKVFDTSFVFRAADYHMQLDSTELKHLEEAVNAAKEELYAKSADRTSDDDQASAEDKKRELAEFLVELASSQNLDRPASDQKNDKSHSGRSAGKRRRQVDGSHGRGMGSVFPARKARQSDTGARLDPSDEKPAIEELHKLDCKPVGRRAARVRSETSFARDVRRATNAFGSFGSALAKAVELSKLAATENP
mmetsp:Transcript_36790/g.57528  ORF Transcript_36790/g.57528 Transcript_36790/m.57528 type:complete len:536 (+) Transcript_36790:262-1869(+)